MCIRDRNPSGNDHCCWHQTCGSELCCSALRLAKNVDGSLNRISRTVALTRESEARRVIYFHHKRATVSCESGVRTGVRTQCRARGQSEATGIILLDAPRWSPLNVVQVDGCGGEMVCTHQLRYPPSRVARFRRTPLAITRETNDTAPRRVGSARSCGCQTFDKPHAMGSVSTQLAGWSAGHYKYSRTAKSNK